MIKFKNTNKQLSKVGFMIVKGLRKELVDQKHNASKKLSNSLRPKVLGKSNVLNIITSKLYWQAVNNPSFAKKANIEQIKKWISYKRIPLAAAASILRKLNDKGYGKPYVYWTDGNTINRTDFAGHTARKFKKKVAQELSPAIGKDVAEMIRSQIRKNNPKARVS